MQLLPTLPPSHPHAEGEGAVAKSIYCRQNSGDRRQEKKSSGQKEGKLQNQSQNLAFRLMQTAAFF